MRDALAVTRKRANELRGVHVPQENLPLVVSGEDLLTVGRNSQAPNMHVDAMSVELPQDEVVFDVPDDSALHGIAEHHGLTPGDEQRPIGPANEAGGAVDRQRSGRVGAGLPALAFSARPAPVDARWVLRPALGPDAGTRPLRWRVEGGGWRVKPLLQKLLIVGRLPKRGEGGLGADRGRIEVSGGGGLFEHPHRRPGFAGAGQFRGGLGQGNAGVGVPCRLRFAREQIEKDLFEFFDLVLPGQGREEIVERVSVQIAAHAEQLFPNGPGFAGDGLDRCVIRVGLVVDQRVAEPDRQDGHLLGLCIILPALVVGGAGVMHGPGGQLLVALRIAAGRGARQRPRAMERLRL